MHGSTPLDALLGDGRQSIRRDLRTFARSALLTGTAISDEAHSLVSCIVDTIIVPFKAASSAVRPKSVEKFRTAVGALLPDLLAARADDKWARLATDTNAFRSYPGGRMAWQTLKPAMVAHGMLDELRGYTGSAGAIVKAAPQCLRATDRLIQMAADHGVHVADRDNHFHRARPPVPDAPAMLVARHEKTKDDAAPKAIPVDFTASKPAAILSSLQRLNAHLMAPGRIDGIVFAGLRRIFSNADRPDFDWQWHGRFYSMPNADRYEGMSIHDRMPHRGARARATVIRIDGEEVSEVDVSACHLTILHGLLGLTFNPDMDPYGFLDVPREDVKNWLTITLGSGEVTLGGNRLSAARKACMARYPFLADLASRGITSLDLQYHESEIMRLAMEELMDRHGIGFLPVHDALMVAKGREGLAVQAIHNGFKRYFGGVFGLDGAPVPRLH